MGGIAELLCLSSVGDGLSTIGLGLQPLVPILSRKIGHEPQVGEHMLKFTRAGCYGSLEVTSSGIHLNVFVDGISEVRLLKVPGRIRSLPHELRPDEVR